MAKKKTKSMKSKPIGITRIPKGIKGQPSGVALVYGSRTNPRFGKKRFKNPAIARKYASKKGMI